MIEFEEIGALERCRAFKTVFGLEGKRSREQEIVWQELVGQFRFFETHQVVAGAGMDPQLAAYNAGKVTQAKTIYDNVSIPETLVTRPEPEVTRRKDRNVDNR